ncbi:hypothetical protein Taro_051896 [Colocasia esculenta]|uniref:Uncharacterized protein n=1 Tax=Colocasia esculenta TaxID=4460 RepID=A0A843XIM6_COLES|nr:hypothetical protein [Colocasia esculenta]
MMASCICSLVFDLTSEDILLMHEGVDASLLERIAQLFVRSLNSAVQYGRDDAREHSDLHQIITAGFSRWAGRFPRLRQAIERFFVYHSWKRACCYPQKMVLLQLALAMQWYPL